MLETQMPSKVLVVSVTQETGGEEIVLPPKYRKAIGIIEKAASVSGARYAIGGSLGIAAVAHEPWTPTKRQGSYIIKRDIDVFTIADDVTRQRFQQALQETYTGEDLPRLDIGSEQESEVRFNEGSATLSYKDISVPVNRSLFETTSIQAGGISIPVLHPRVYAEIINLSPVVMPKIRQRIRSLIKASRNMPLDKEDLKPFGQFKKLVYKKYYPERAVLVARRNLYRLEEEGDRFALIKLKIFIREKYPKIAAFLRDVLR